MLAVSQEMKKGEELPLPSLGYRTLAGREICSCPTIMKISKREHGTVDCEHTGLLTDSASRELRVRSLTSDKATMGR